MSQKLTNEILEKIENHKVDNHFENNYEENKFKFYLSEKGEIVLQIDENEFQLNRKQALAMKNELYRIVGKKTQYNDIFSYRRA